MDIPTMNWEDAIKSLAGVGVTIAKTKQGAAVLVRKSSDGDIHMHPIPKLDLPVTPGVLDAVCRALFIDAEKFLQFIKGEAR